MALKKNTGVNALRQHANVSVDSHTAAVQEPIQQEPEMQQPAVIQNAEHEKKKRKYLRLDITDYQDYIHLMAEHKKTATGEYVSMTQYILRLIDADKQNNLALYEKLMDIENMKRNLI